MVFSLLDDVKRQENGEGKRQQCQHQKDPYPELSFTDSLRVRIPRMDLGINIVPETGTSAPRKDRMKNPVLITASRTGERTFIVSHECFSQVRVIHRGFSQLFSIQVLFKFRLILNA
jgi:hypothetical protein